MDIMEIILLIVGGVIFVLSFFIPDKKGASAGGLGPDDISALMDRELAAVRGRLDEAVEEAVSDATEKTERSLGRITNEKIMAVNEYSDTVLTEIRKSHEEVMFLYDMLNNKHTSLKNTAAELNRAVKEAQGAAAALERQKAAGEDADLAPETLAEQGMAAPEPEAAVTEETAAAAGFHGDAESGDYVSNKEKIRSLHRQGKSPADIARELELGVGEVKLVIDLYQNQ